MARIRTFIAVEINDRIRQRITDLQEKLAKKCPDVKWASPENLHITLAFLGEIDEIEVVSVCRVVTQVCKKFPAFTMSIGGFGCFPNPRRPKVLWVGIQMGIDELRALHAALEEELMELACFRREDRAYSPHLTLGRISKDEEKFNWAPIFEEYSDWDCGTVVVNEVHVMSSELQASGPVYAVMSRSDLDSKK